MKVAIFGAGAWGTALAQHTSARHSVLLVARDNATARAIQNQRRNQRYLPEVALNDAIEVCADTRFALGWLGGDSDSLAVIASSMSGLPSLTQQFARGSANASIKASINAPVKASINALIWLSKGLVTRQRPAGGHDICLAHQIVAHELPAVAAGPLLGPSFALEVARGQPAALTVASGDDRLANLAVKAFHFNGVRIYRSDDVIGVELGGALKNVVAIATGICDGLQLGMNARAALITRGLAETARLGVAMGARAETFMGLTGLGDLVLTATGDLSRNRRVGLELASGRSLTEILSALGHVAEGVNSVDAAVSLGQQYKVELPICEAVAQVLHGRSTAAQAVAQLLSREPKQE